MEMGSESHAGKSWCEALYEERAAGLILYGRALGLSHSEAEDVVQETFIALLKLPSTPDEPLNYCLRAFRNKAMNYHRSLWRRLTRELEFQRWFDPKGDESPQELAAMRCLEQLPSDQREVIVLKVWHQHTFDEIGRLLEVSPNTVAGRYRYGIQKLRHCLRVRGQYDERWESFGDADAVLDASSPLPGT